MPALLLGAAGLIPFVGSSLCLLFAPDVLGLNSGLLHMVLVTYAALIASFLGGVRWGNALAKPEQYGREFIIAVMPSLVAVNRRGGRNLVLPQQIVPKLPSLFHPRVVVPARR